MRLTDELNIKLRLLECTEYVVYDIEVTIVDSVISVYYVCISELD